MGSIEASAPWHDIAEEKRLYRDATIPKAWRIDISQYKTRQNVIDVPLTCGLLNAKEVKITSDLDAVDIVEAIKHGVFTVEEVVTAFCKRAAVAQQVTNCLTEMMFDQAIAEARRMDLELQENPTKPLPPLYGLPISLKDGFKVPGFDATIGFVSLVGQKATTYSALPQLLKDLGAIFHCKTNVPQTLMSADSDNNLFGRTINPHNTSLTAGGSSGGEGALIAMRGSLLGVGTDIAGSVRIPPVCNGIYGFKASASVIPYAGQQSPASPGIPGILPSIGPLATSARACAFFMKTVMEAKPWKYDGTVLHLPWQNWAPGHTQPLRIGYIENNGMHTPSPPIRRAMSESIEKLRRAGHEIVPIILEDVTADVDNCWDMFGMDGSQLAMNLIRASGEPVVPSVKMAALLGKPAKTLSEVQKLGFARLVARSKYAKIWTTHNVDVILTAPSAHTAVPHDTWFSVSYTSFFNYLDWPATVLPVGKVTEDDVADQKWRFGPRDEHVYKNYTGPDDYKDAPTTIQLVGEPQEDEKLAFYAELIDRILRAI